MQVQADDGVWAGLLPPVNLDPLGRGRTPVVAADWDEDVLAGLVYSAGIAGHHDLLARVPGQRLPSGVRRAVDWWRGMPGEVLESVRT